ncbi:TspO/MBR family protein [Halomonas sp. WWR20]
MSEFSTRHQAIGLVVWLAICFVAAAIGAVASIDAAAFYARLEQPGWAPPAAAFGPIWTTLYALMAVAAWWVWRIGGFRNAREALTLFLVQLAVNALWSWLFFVWHLGALSFACVVVLWAMIVITLVAFWRLRRLAGLLMLPYLLWVGVAMALTYSVWHANPQLLG